MNIWFVNQYASEPSLGAPGRHYFLAKELSKMGNNLTIITSSHTHLRLKNKQIKGAWAKSNVDGVDFLWLKVFKYRSSNSLIRIINWLIFSFNILFAPVIVKSRPKVIVYSSPSLFGYISCYLLSKIFQCKLVFEVRDIWPKSLIELGGISSRHPLMRLMSLIEGFAYRTADRVWSNLQHANLHMLEHGLVEPEKFSWFPNGAIVESNEVNSSEQLLSETYLRIKKLKEDRKIIGYIGTVGNANALTNLVEAAKLSQNKNIAFVIIGNGNEKGILLEYVKKNGLKNIFIFDAVPFELVKKHIELFDICFLGTKGIELYKYGIASLKLPEYMLCQKPIIHAALNSVVDDAKCGERVLPDSPKLLVDAIERLLNMPDDRLRELGLNGELYAKKVFNYNSIAKAIDKELKEYA